jgi:hypothetical protein
VYVSKQEYHSAAVKGKAYSYVNAGERFYYAGLDGRYFYIDEKSGRKKYVDRQTYERFLQGSPSRYRPHVTGGRW